MSHFSGAHDVVVTGSEFIGQQTNHINIGRSGTLTERLSHSADDITGIDLLLEASTPEAAVDAVERNYAPSCFPGTRDQYIEDITNWATSSSIDRPPIYWMKGPAGVGKSAIAQTSVLKVKEAGYLGAAFFFSVNGRQDDHTRFFPSLAYQLSTILPAYTEILDKRVLSDKTIFRKTMKSQFEALVVDPLRRLEALGKEVLRKAVFVDGLDECKDKDAQAEIIEIIASSVRAQSTPFQWAIFSREEPWISSTFALPHISPHCHVVFLPISRDTDQEIEAYLRGEFKNILRRRLGNMGLSSPWPIDEDIQKLVDAAAGLFAYAATILRFIDSHSHSRFRETLQSVLDNIVNPRPPSLPMFANLDRLYTLILQGVPTDIASSTNFLLYEMTLWPSTNPLIVATICNELRISEAVFKIICCYLHAVLAYHVPPVQPSEILAWDIGPRCSFLEQDISFKRNAALRDQLHKIHGSIRFLHKSFYDFLRDRKRSGSTFNRDGIFAQLRLHHYNQHLRLTPLYDFRGSSASSQLSLGHILTLINYFRT